MDKKIIISLLIVFQFFIGFLALYMIFVDKIVAIFLFISLMFSKNLIEQLKNKNTTDVI